MLFEGNVPCGKTLTVPYRFPPGPLFLGQSGGTIDGWETSVGEKHLATTYMGEKAVGEMGEKSAWVKNIGLKSQRVTNIRVNNIYGWKTFMDKKLVGEKHMGEKFVGEKKQHICG